MSGYSFTTGGTAVYDASGAFLGADAYANVVTENPASGALNGILDIGEGFTYNDIYGTGHHEVFLGLATVDGQQVIVADGGSGYHFVHAPTGVTASSMTWPATFDVITYNSLMSFGMGVPTGADYTTGGTAVYDASGAFLGADAYANVFTENPASGALNGILDVGEGFTYNDIYGTGHHEVFLGLATVDGQQVIVADGGGGFHFVYAPTGVTASSLTWPTTFDEITYNPLMSFAMCFAQGTAILTLQGEVPVEAIEIGDRVVTSEGRAVPVKWIGRQTVHTRFGPAERLMPVRFAAGSLGDGLPDADLTVTADHAMLIDGVLVHAGALVNGTTITRVPLSEMRQTFTVYHIETEAHEIILANGAPAETFIDNVSRRAFDNYDEFEALYGDVPEMEELDYPRAMSARQVPPAIKKKLGIQKVA